MYYCECLQPDFDLDGRCNICGYYDFDEFEDDDDYFDQDIDDD